MSEQTKGILSSVVILACFALLGYMVHVKAEGATMAAISTVAIVIAWLTKSPRNDPPTGMVVLAGIASAWALAACIPQQVAADEAEKAFRDQQRACVRQYETRDQIMACRKAVNESWGIVETVTDAGATDGGVK